MERNKNREERYIRRLAVTTIEKTRSGFCSSRIRPLGNYDDIALIDRIVDIVVMMTSRFVFVKTISD